MCNHPNQTRATAPSWSGDRHGFTLIEVLVAMAVIAIVVIAVFKLNAQTIDMTNATRFHTIAPLLAHSKLAEIENQSSEDAISDTGDFGDIYPGFQWQVTIESALSETLGETAENLKKIDLIVSFNDQGSVYKLTCYRFFAE